LKPLQTECWKKDMGRRLRLKLENYIYLERMHLGTYVKLSNLPELLPCHHVVWRSVEGSVKIYGRNYGWLISS
jgi:hypothetical protein